ncbi:MAG: hypothetical protein LBR87_03440 [Synergistaceae bacterium]|jgi:hypothetical protein|nr:hypothetical protein [Synergistaceae bacterium]
MSRRFFFSIIMEILVLFFFLGGTARANVPSMPEIQGWECGELTDIRFDAVSGNYGHWQAREYKTPSGAPVKASIMYGNGPKFYNLPPDGVSYTDPNGSGAYYEIIRVKGFRSLIEYSPITGYSVAVNAYERQFSLTVECGPFEKRGDALRYAESILDAVISASS